MSGAASESRIAGFESVFIAPSDTSVLLAEQAAQHKEAEAVLQQRDRYITRLEGRLLANRRASAPSRFVLDNSPPAHMPCLGLLFHVGFIQLKSFALSRIRGQGCQQPGCTYGLPWA